MPVHAGQRRRGGTEDRVVAGRRWSGGPRPRRLRARGPAMTSAAERGGQLLGAEADAEDRQPGVDARRAGARVRARARSRSSCTPMGPPMAMRPAMRGDVGRRGNGLAEVETDDARGGRRWRRWPGRARRDPRRPRAGARPRDRRYPCRAFLGDAGDPVQLGRRSLGESGPLTARPAPRPGPARGCPRGQPIWLLWHRSASTLRSTVPVVSTATVICGVPGGPMIQSSGTVQGSRRSTSSSSGWAKGLRASG